MARPSRNNVDYFPFLCKEGKAMYYIETTYGNDGYATWVKMLRELAVANNHYLNLSDKVNLMFLASKCRVSQEVLLNILNDLSDLGEINTELWVEAKVVWSQKFIDHIQDAYSKRNNKCIDLLNLRILLTGLRILKPSLQTLKDPVKPQSKEKKSKEEKSKEEKSDFHMENENKNENRFNKKGIAEFLLFESAKENDPLFYDFVDSYKKILLETFPKDFMNIQVMPLMDFSPIAREMIRSYGIEDIKKVLKNAGQSDFWKPHLYNLGAISKNFMAIKNLKIEKNSKSEEKPIYKAPAKIDFSTLE